MKTILVPTDFSALSMASIRYALKMAKKVKSEIILLHVISLSSSETLLKKQKLVDELNHIAVEDARRFIDDLRKELGENINIRHAIEEGYPLHTVIDRYAQNNGVSLIVMGTHGASGMRKIIGSNAYSVINNSSVPVVAVPPDAKFRIKKMVYAADLSDLRKELELVVTIASMFDAAVDVLHIRAEGQATKAEQDRIEKMIDDTEYPKVTFHEVISEDIAQAIDGYVRKAKPDLLALFTHKTDFFEKLFGKSVTRELALHNQTPLLTFNKTRFGELIYS
jgi:nucleotide-binding universal stress UspA family protein